MKNSDESTRERLVGTWLSEPIQTEWGPAAFELTFQKDGHLKFSMLSPTGAGPGLTREGKYKVSKGQLVSEVFDKGQPAAASFDGRELIIDTASESPWRFKRK
jgi:hypothetical protein